MGNCGEKNITQDLNVNPIQQSPQKIVEDTNHINQQQSPVKSNLIAEPVIQHLPDMQGLEKLSAEELQKRFVYSPEQESTIKNLPAFDYDQDEKHHNIQAIQHQAIYVKSSDSIYEGSWFNEKPSGKGKMRYQNGNIYEGYWKDGQRSGYGRLLYLNGNYYQGEWNQDEINGQGKLQDLIQGIVIEGTWRNGQLNGLGSEEHQPKNKNEVSILSYKGEYVNGKKHGRGVLIYSDSSKYEGEFYDDFIQGNGEFKWADKRAYKGQFHANKMQGQGTATWDNGCKYVGSYLNDLKHGYGEFYWSDQRVYKGNWIQGTQEGYGILINSENVSRKCQFHQGKFVSWVEETENIEEKNRQLLQEWEKQQNQQKVQ